MVVLRCEIYTYEWYHTREYTDLLFVIVYRICMRLEGECRYVHSTTLDTAMIRLIRS